MLAPAQLAEPHAVAPIWEVAKGVMMTLVTGGVWWIARTVFALRDDMRDIKHEVCDPKTGLKALVARNDARIGLIEDRNLVIDAVAKLEKEEYDGDERRHGLRSVQAMIRNEVDAALREQEKP